MEGVQIDVIKHFLKEYFARIVEKAVSLLR